MIVTSADDGGFRRVALSNKLRPRQFLHGGLDNGIFPASSMGPDETTKCFMRSAGSVRKGRRLKT